jgi:hypothetical protein
MSDIIMICCNDFSTVTAELIIFLLFKLQCTNDAHDLLVGMDTCIETNEILAFGIMMEVYSRYIPDICKNLEYVRHIPDICLTYDTIRIPDGLPAAARPRACSASHSLPA